MRGFRRRFWFVLVTLAAPVAAATVPATALPNEVSVRSPTSFELLRDGKPAGRLELAVGQKLAVVDVRDGYVLARYRNLNGRVLVADTTLPAEFFPPAAPAATPLPPSGLPPPAPAVAATATPHSPATPMELMLADKLVALEGGALRPFAAARLTGVKFYAIYFSAGWCPPCREFTPEFMDAYVKLRSVYPEFETVLVNRDRSPAAMLEYMRDDAMKWPALRWDQVRGTALNRYAGAGIPCLVLVDENGQVLSDSYRWGRYVGPDAVLDDAWKILRDYRRKHPRQKT
jgi:nucleoredoxin